MTANRRSFVKQVTALAGAFSANSLFNFAHAADWQNANDKLGNKTAIEVAGDEDYWSVIQRAFTVSSSIIILNNGGVSPSPLVVQEAVERYNQLANQGPSYF